MKKILFWLILFLLTNTSAIEKKEEKKEIRKEIIKKVLEKYNVVLFGYALDNLEKYIKLEKNRKINLVELVDKIKKEDIPENFFVDVMNLEVLINKNNFSIHVYQNYNSQKILLLESKVAIGGKCKDYSTGKYRYFPTPSGQFYIKRIVEWPYWYPPKWAKEFQKGKKVLLPSLTKNPYGKWMTELSRNKKPADYSFAITSDSKIRLHSTNKPESIGKAITHSCIRIYPFVAEEFFSALLHYSPHKEGKKTARGTIYPFEEGYVIPVKIE